MKLGIVLAAGEASRLPNKPLLPIGDDTIAIESALLFCTDAHVDRTYVVQNVTRVVERVLEMRGHEELEFLTQPAAYGVSDAISRVPTHAGDAVLVTFCDNVYPAGDLPRLKDYLDTPEVDNVASVRTVEGGEELDAWDEQGEKWVDRTQAKKSWPRLAGWYVLTADAAASGRVNEESVEYLNRVGARGIILPTRDWCDIGTPEAYSKFLEKGVKVTI